MNTTKNKIIFWTATGIVAAVGRIVRLEVRHVRQPDLRTQQFRLVGARPGEQPVDPLENLPGLVLAEQINPIIQSVNKLGLAVRGLYGEGTEALGNVFQVSNQMTLGEAESAIVERLDALIGLNDCGLAACAYTQRQIGLAL